MDKELTGAISLLLAGILNSFLFFAGFVLRLGSQTVLFIVLGTLIGIIPVILILFYLIKRKLFFKSTLLLCLVIMFFNFGASSFGLQRVDNLAGQLALIFAITPGILALLAAIFLSLGRRNKHR